MRVSGQKGCADCSVLCRWMRRWGWEAILGCEERKEERNERTNERRKEGVRKMGRDGDEPEDEADRLERRLGNEREKQDLRG